jgi:transposase
MRSVFHLAYHVTDLDASRRFIVMYSAARRAAVRTRGTALLGIKGIGPEFATILYTEGLFRHFDNRRQIASYAGLAPSPWQSGNVNREQGRV